jgi:hypothetical protein
MIVWPDDEQPWHLWMIGVNTGFYMIVAIILVYLFLSVKYRIAHPFWSRQPVFHHMNFSWWVNPPGIIEPRGAVTPATPYYDPWSVKLYEVGSGYTEAELSTMKNDENPGTGSGGEGVAVATAVANSVGDLPGGWPSGKILKQQNLTASALRSAWHLVRGHYLRHPGLAEYTPPWNQFISHMLSHSTPAHVGLYYKATTAYNQDTLSKGTLAVKYDKPVSCMITRPVDCVFLREMRETVAEGKTGLVKNGIAGMPAVATAATSRLPAVGYVDFLCTHSDHRKQSITPKLIYSHYKMLKDAETSTTAKTTAIPSVFLFKREGELAPFVPLVVYNSYCYDTLYWPAAGARKDVEANIIDATNFPLFVRALDHIRDDSANLDIHIQAGHGNLKEQIACGLLVPVVFIRKNNALAPFIGVVILRISGTTYRSAGLVELLATYMTGYGERTEEQRRWFAAMVRDICVHITHSRKARYLLIEDLGHTQEVLSELHGKFTAQFFSPTAYYFYNYATHPADRHRSWILM